MNEEIVAHQQTPEKDIKKNFFREIFEILIFVIPTVLIIQTFIGRTFIVIGNSMYPTFEHGNYLIIDKLTYHFNDPKRFDVIVFHPPQDKKTYYIKRIVGLPGETVYVNNNTITIKQTNGEILTLNETYRSSDGNQITETTLKEGEYFVMGDNRSVSSDSRAWGALPEKNISGRAFIRLFPIGDAGIFPGSYEENTK